MQLQQQAARQAPNWPEGQEAGAGLPWSVVGGLQQLEVVPEQAAGLEMPWLTGTAGLLLMCHLAWPALHAAEPAHEDQFGILAVLAGSKIQEAGSAVSGLLLQNCHRAMHAR